MHIVIDSFSYLAVAAVVIVCIAASPPCPTQCFCDFEDETNYFNCTVSDTKVILKQSQYPLSEWELICEESIFEINCLDLPRIEDLDTPITKLLMTTCPPNILTCMEDVFHGAKVDHLELYNMSETLTSEHVKYLKQVIDLKIFLTEKDTVFPRDAINSLPELNTLQVWYGSFQLTANDLDGISLHELDLGFNNMTSLPAGFFKQLPKLEVLYIQSNRLNNIHADTFLGGDSLQIISLKDNNIKSIKVGAFSTTPNLIDFGISENELSSVPNGLFKGLEKLIGILLVDNKVEMSLGSHVFSHLPSIVIITLQACRIKTLPENLLLGSHTIESLKISENNIRGLPSKIFANLFKLRELDLSNNGIEDLPDLIFADLKTLRKLDLNGNKLKSVSESVVTSLSSLTELYLRNNHLSHVYVQNHIHLLRIPSDQKISESLYEDSNPEFYTEIEGFKLQSLPRLARLDLSGNGIHSLYEGWSSMIDIKLMDLSRNSFYDIKDLNVNFSNLSIVIDLENNNITDMVLDPRVSPTNEPRTSRSHLVLGNNPLNCDCNILGLYRRGIGFRPKGPDTEPIFHLDNLRCDSPPSLAGQLLTDISPDRLVCDLPDQCPDNCTCSAKAVTNELVIDCLKIPSTINATEAEDLPYKYFEEPRITLNLKYQPNSIRDFNIHTLNLSNVGLHKIAFTRTKSLKILDISHNKLSSIPSEFLEPNINLYLSDNPLECECFLVKALKKKGLVSDLEEVTCVTGEKITQIDLCSESKSLVVQIGTTAVCSLFVLIIVKTIYTNFNKIRSYILRNILHQRDDTQTQITEMRLDASKQFDLFISYAHQDEEFIAGTLLPTLENKYKQKVCVHSRDWIVGDMITDQIINSVDSSKRTLIVLTENFLVSEWSYLEFRTAHNLSIREGRPRVIIILLDEAITRDERLGTELKSYIAVNTYLVWGDPNFWEKLKKLLPIQRRK